MQSFVAGIIRAISDYENKFDNNRLLNKMFWIKHKQREYNKNLPIEYMSILWDIKHNIAQDFWTDLNWKTIQDRLKKDKNLFLNPNYENNWFNRIYFDLFEDCKKGIKEIEWK